MKGSFRVIIMLISEYKVEVVERCLCRPSLRSPRLETAQTSSRFGSKKVLKVHPARLALVLY